MLKVKLFATSWRSIFFVSCLFCLGCNNNSNIENAETVINDASTKAAPNPTPSDRKSLLGSYSGAFGDNVITVKLTTITADSVWGRSVVAGNDRPFTGTISEENSLFGFAAKEPGSEKHDGIFTFSIPKNDPEKLQGQWKPFDTAVTAAKLFTLQKKEFKYDPTTGEFTIASERLLKNEDVENLDQWDLSIMRNSIFARHGYCFSRKEMRDNFESQAWYIPYSTDITNDLTAIEKKNISLIKKYEKYAMEYGDDFGR